MITRQRIAGWLACLAQRISPESCRDVPADAPPAIPPDHVLMPRKLSMMARTKGTNAFWNSRQDMQAVFDAFVAECQADARSDAQRNLRDGA